MFINGLVMLFVPPIAKTMELRLIHRAVEEESFLTRSTNARMFLTRCTTTPTTSSGKTTIYQEDAVDHGSAGSFYHKDVWHLTTRRFITAQVWVLSLDQSLLHVSIPLVASVVLQ